jgi:UDP-N-acetylmuramoylalanine--D-glutamate ligase
VYASDVSATPEVDTTARALRDEESARTSAATTTERIARASSHRREPRGTRRAPPFARRAKRGVDIVSEIEVALRFLPRLSYIAITGTNGKTTTTSLTGHLLNALGRRASTAGNIGTPLSELAASRTPPAWVALEISSFQLHDTPSIDPTVGVLTNLSANHLDRYSGVDEYYGDKMLLFRNAEPTSTWVTNADDADSQRLTGKLSGLHCHFSVRQTGAAEAESYFDRDTGMLVVLGQALMPRSELPLLGDHNVANALAAALSVMLADREHRTSHALAQSREAMGGFEAI